MDENKSEIREEMRRRFGQYDIADLQRAGLRISIICQALLNQRLKPRSLMSYISRRDEPRTHDIIRGSLTHGLRVCVPVYDPRDHTIAPSELRNFTTDLQRGYAGILEPRDTCRRPVEPMEIDVQIVPGLAFDRLGHRLGRGAGAYDRLLSGCPPETIKIGLAFAWQVLAELPAEDHDIAMDLVVTDLGVLVIRPGLIDEE